MDFLYKATANSFLFSGLDVLQKEKLFKAMKRENREQGECIIKQGEAGDYFYVIQCGTIEVYIDGKLITNCHEGRYGF